MRPISKRVRNILQADPFMTRCSHNIRKLAQRCDGRIEWEHVWLYAGRQIDEAWAIIPLCTYHHRGKGLDKNFNRFVSLLRVTTDDAKEMLRLYPRTDWAQQRKWLVGIYKDQVRT